MGKELTDEDIQQMQEGFDKIDQTKYVTKRDYLYAVALAKDLAHEFSRYIGKCDNHTTDHIENLIDQAESL